MKKRALFYGLFILHMALVQAQYVVNSPNELMQLKKLPLEKMYVHHNSSVLMPGEYMYYSMYCINAATNKLSRTSRMGYIELVGEDLETKIIQKVRLNKGRGQGDFFIPVSLPSGNYKLIGYTQWMKNAGIKQLYQDDITIINPYRTDQDAIVESSSDSISQQLSKNLDIASSKNEGILLFETVKQSYKKREKVSLIPRNYKGPLGYGSYSISVHLKNELNSHDPLDAVAYGNEYLNADKQLSKSVQDSIYLPEQRGELFFGKVKAREEGLSEVDKTVVISIPGEDFQLKSAQTDKNGIFYTYLQKEYEAPVILAQLIDDEREKYDLSFKNASPLSYTGLEFQSYKLPAKLKDALIARSVHNQIENGYYSVKPDSILAIDKIDPFIGGQPEKIVLADYTRFKTMRETLIEIVDKVWVKKLDNGSYTFWVEKEFEAFDENYAQDPPIVLIDGVFIPDHTSILEFNTRTVKTLSILRDPLGLGSKKYHGILAIETDEGDFLETYSNAGMGKAELVMPTAKKNYFRQQYDDATVEKQKRIPDFRYQLFWEPKVTIDEKQSSFEFFTSDVPGTYEIVLEGFTTYGKPISVRKTFTVE